MKTRLYIVNRLLYAGAVVLTTWMMVQCSGNRQDESNEAVTEEVADDDEWKGMDDFHMVMAESFHPYKDSANLEPAKQLAAEMADLAARWADDPLPAKVDTDNVRQMLDELKTQTSAFAAQVSAGDTTSMGESLNRIHDHFHHLMETWYNSGTHEHEH